MNTRYKSFEELIVWQESMQLCIDLNHLLWNCKDTYLRDQARRSSISVPSNIAEGFESHGDKMYIKYLYTSKGSCGELRTQLYLLQELGYVDAPKCADLTRRAKRISGMLQNMISSKRKAMNPQT